jgi:hypothetical protein
MKDGKLEARGEFVRVTYRGQTVEAMVVLVSPNGESAALMFDAMLGGHVGMMPILWEGGRYRSLMEGEALELAPSQKGRN